MHIYNSLLQNKQTLLSFSVFYFQLCKRSYIIYRLATLVERMTGMVLATVSIWPVLVRNVVTHVSEWHTRSAHARSGRFEAFARVPGEADINPTA